MTENLTWVGLESRLESRWLLSLVELAGLIYAIESRRAQTTEFEKEEKSNSHRWLLARMLSVCVQSRNLFSHVCFIFSLAFTLIIIVACLNISFALNVAVVPFLLQRATTALTVALASLHLVNSINSDHRMFRVCYVQFNWTGSLLVNGSLLFLIITWGFLFRWCHEENSIYFAVIIIVLNRTRPEKTVQLNPDRILNWSPGSESTSCDKSSNIQRSFLFVYFFFFCILITDFRLHCWTIRYYSCNCWLIAYFDY